MAQLTGNCPWDFDVTLRAINVQKIGRAETSIALSNQEEIELLILNQGVEPVSDLTVSYQLNHGNIVSEVVPTTLAPGDSLRYAFARKANLFNPGLYEVDAWISSTQDSRIHNDSIVGVVQARQLPNYPINLRIIINLYGQLTYLGLT